MNKAQTEIMGLVVIVILIAVGLLFFVFFNLNKEPDEFKDKVTTSILASSTLTSLQGTTTDCRGLKIKDLLLDCANRGATGNTIVCPNQETSCFFVNKTITYILNKTVGNDPNGEYKFSAFVNEVPLVGVGVDTGCKGQREGIVQPLRTTRGYDLNLYLDVCR